MIITKVNIRLKKEARLKAVVSLCIEDRYWLNDIKLILCNDGKLKAEFPKLDNTRFFFMPINQDARTDIENKLLRAYSDKLATEYACPESP